MTCDQEMCPMWDGEGCPCDRFGLDKDDLPTDGVFTVEQPTPAQRFEQLRRMGPKHGRSQMDEMKRLEEILDQEEEHRP